MRPTLFLMCGLPGAGKTTRAKQLEQERNALRLTPDEWMQRIVRSGEDEEKRAAIEMIMGEIAERSLCLGMNVILDFGFWSRAERDDFKARAKKVGARCELHFLDVSFDDLLKRLKERNSALPENTFTVTEDQLKLWSTLFEVPLHDELHTNSKKERA